jgi:hypothetical protein
VNLKGKNSTETIEMWEQIAVNVKVKECELKAH